MTSKLRYALAILLAGCAGSVILMPYPGIEPEPSIYDRVIDEGHSYGCATREVTVKNPTDEALSVDVSCRCDGSSPVQFQLPGHKQATFAVKSGYYLNTHDHVCSFHWQFAGEGQ